ncbi:pentapeptide repeat-containing protein [Rhodococcus oxybenzonivorans]|uniref:pentapeptide repeat-containing protein n=1 Tax=Rhodococcus TaxID=1827 RepID=UPI0037C83A3A
MPTCRPNRPKISVSSGNGSTSDHRASRPFRGIDLREQKVSGLQLQSADFQAASMLRADLTSAKPTDANFQRGEPHRCAPGRVDLTGSLLFNTDLTRTDLTYSVLGGRC